ncbi:MAG: hypothetical protein Q8P52_01810 [bacterium]|nr:hypothetical protein [bacterium]
MRYIPSSEVKEKQTPYHGIDDMSPWTIADGTFRHILDNYVKIEKQSAYLDIGCGSGAAFRATENRFAKMCGIDLVSYLPP